jgi:hypothetical protein
MLLFAALFGVLISSCEQEEALQSQHVALTKTSVNQPITNIVLSPVPQCELVSVDWSNTSIIPGQTKTFEIKYYAGAIYKWTASGSIAIVGADNTNKVTIQAAKKGSGTLSVTMDVPGNATLACGNTGTIVVQLGGGDGPPSCGCPSPKIITKNLCVSGGHPHWRLQVINVSSGDQIRWYTQHATIMGSNNTENVTVKVLQDAAAGFTVYCQVTRPCSGGVEKSRTAYYTNYYGQSCEAGTSGFSNSCNGGAPGNDDLK